MSGYDVWWHLAAGRDMVTSGTLLPVDTWSFTAPGAAWPTKDVLSELLFYGLFSLGGPDLLQLVKLVVPLAILASMVTAMRREGAPDTTIALACALAYPAASFRFIERPVIFSLLGIVAYWLVLSLEESRLRTFGRHHPAFLALPAMQLAWMWTHREGMLGAGMVCLFALDAVAGALVGSRHLVRHGPRSSGRALTGILAVSAGVVAATLMGPAGTDVLAVSAGSEASAVLRDIVPNWGLATPAVLFKSFPTWVALLAAFVLALFLGEPVRLYRALILVGFIALGTWAIRFLPCFALCAPLALASSGKWRLGSRGRALARLALAPWPATALVVAMALFSFVVVTARGERLARGFDERRYPAGAVEFMLDHGFGGNIYNPLHWGGYLVFNMPGRAKVFVDGRSDVVYPAEVIDLAARATSDPAAFDKLERRHDPDLVLTEYASDRMPCAWLAQRRDWVPIYWDDHSLLWARIRHPRDPVRSFAFTDLSPIMPLESIEDALAAGRFIAIAQEVERVLATDPRSLMGRFLKGYMLAASGEDDAVVEAEIEAMREVRPSFAGIDLVEMRKLAADIQAGRAMGGSP